ncbi:MAG: hypothetical protein IPF53_00760 [Blastocatellia bacterium]|nr:hypothetical protein [Blastocatellia bacterium]MBK6425190.1 hypothetical protein [Blastocatellia bacterium]
MLTTRKTSRLGAILIPVLLTLTATAQADTLARRQNVVDLIEHAEIILRGDVVGVTDGIENNIPYTEIRVKVKESLRGGVSGTYTFRQFGLLAPRKMGNGLVNYMVNPAGWSTYRQNEDVILFLYKSASKTGLRTTVGLGQGKFSINGGRAVSQQGNVGLFAGMTIDGSLDKTDSEMLQTTRGSISAEAFLSFVRRAVNDRWIETRRMHRA